MVYSRCSKGRKRLTLLPPPRLTGSSAPWISHGGNWLLQGEVRVEETQERVEMLLKRLSPKGDSRDTRRMFAREARGFRWEKAGGQVHSKGQR